MARKSGPSDGDYDNAARLGLLSLAADEGSDVDAIVEQLAALQPRNDTFPPEVGGEVGRSAPPASANA